MTDRFVGPVPIASAPKQPTWNVPYCLAWSAFDLPRIWDMVEREGSEAAWEQVNGFTFLADFLEDQYRLWRSQRDQIAEAWQSPAATEFLKVMDKFTDDLLSDATCARQTSLAWNRTVEALGNARSRMEPLKEQWDSATSRHGHEGWDALANHLNQQARKIMTETDKAVADARPLITSPSPNEAWKLKEPTVIEEGPFPASTSPPPGGAASATSRTRVPPVPGYEPLTEVQTGPELTASRPTSLPPGAARLVEAVPGTPVSMLPIPPGSAYAPFGGAYILPGPGVGRGGYVVPMPQPPGTGSMTGPRTLLPPAAAAAGGAGGGVPGGMMPVPMAGGATGAGGGHGPLYRRPSVAWHVDEGVPPVIKVDHDEFVPGQPTPKQEEEFKDWFTDLAYPWRAEFKNSEGAQVTIRTVQE
jgi:hypothetical protein